MIASSPTEIAAFVTTLRNLASSQNETIFWDAAEFIEGLCDAHNARVSELLSHNNELLERSRAYGCGFIGIEARPEYFDLACRRVGEALKQPDLFIERPARAKPLELELTTARP